MEGNICVQQSPQAGSALPVKQVLEQSYNKTAKGNGVVIEHIVHPTLSTWGWSLLSNFHKGGGGGRGLTGFRFLEGGFWERGE